MAALVVASGLCIAAPSASAGITTASQHELASAGLPSGASPYGEVARFGGFDASGEHLGKFVLPVGFAVDPSESNAVYVLDRVVSEEAEEGGTLQYRLQKLSSTGTPIASVLLPAESYTSEDKTGAHPLIGLAVDSANHRVYTLVQNIINDGKGEQTVPVVERLVAWSTKPEGAKLVPAPGFKEADPVTGAALVAGASALEPAKASEAFYLPQALTVDPSHNVVIEAADGVKSGPTGGPMVLEQVKIQGAEGEKVGVLGEHFTAETTIAPKSQIGDGLFTTQNGSLGLDMWTSGGDVSRLATIHTSLSEPKPELLAEDKSGGVNRDQAASIDNEDTIAYQEQFDNGFVLKPYAAGSPITQLTNGLYAARYAHVGATYIDPQSISVPWEGVDVFWAQGNFSTKEVANEGIRLFTSSGTVVTTIGGQPSAPCNINYAAVALAAGSREKLFALTQPNPENENSGGEVIEFAPGGKGACPQPTGTVSVNGKAVKSITVKHGEPVTFSDTVERKGETPFRFDWFLLNNETLGLEDLISQMQESAYRWPAPSTTHTFTTPGTYYLASTLYGDYGVTAMTPTVVEIKVE